MQFAFFHWFILKTEFRIENNVVVSTIIEMFDPAVDRFSLKLPFLDFLGRRKNRRPLDTCSAFRAVPVGADRMRRRGPVAESRRNA
jgi:hypothetical protein